MAHYTLALDPELGPSKAMRVQADSLEDDGATLTFWKDGRIVNTIPRPRVLEVERFETDLEARAHARAIQKRKKGACSLQVQEVKLPPRG